MKRNLVSCLLSLIAAGALARPAASSADTTGIQAVIDAFRSTIQQRDKARFMDLFISPTVPWQSVLTDQGLVQVRPEFPQTIKARFKPENNSTAFIDAIVRGQASTEETFSNVRIDADADVATVTFDYQFLTGGEMKNWGKECWLLVRTESGWKITSLAYSVTLATKPPSR